MSVQKKRKVTISLPGALQKKSLSFLDDDHLPVRDKHVKKDISYFNSNFLHAGWFRLADEEKN